MSTDKARAEFERLIDKVLVRADCYAKEGQPFAAVARDIIIDLRSQLAAANAEVARLRAEREWRPIETATGDEIWAGFMGQFNKWIAVVARWTPEGYKAQGYASPTHWQPLPTPPPTPEPRTMKEE